MSSDDAGTSSKRTLTLDPFCGGAGEWIREFFADIEAMDAPEYEGAGQVIGGWGWTLPYSVRPVEVLHLMGMSSEAGSEQMDTWYVSKYAIKAPGFSHLESSLLGNSQLETWHDILGQCVWAYRRRRYGLIVPTTLAVLEAVLADIAGYRRVKEHRTLKMWDQVKRPDTGPDVVRWNAAKAFLRTLYAGHPFDQDRPAVLNRHWVIHGRDLSFQTQANALRLLTGVSAIGELWEDGVLGPTLQKVPIQQRAVDGAPHNLYDEFLAAQEQEPPRHEKTPTS